MIQRNYRDIETDKIINDKNNKYPKNIALALAWTLGNLKGINLKILDVKSITSIAEYFILASATNNTQAKSMAEEVSRQLKRNNCPIISREGIGNSDWILIDGSDVIVHIFLEYSRESYNLDYIWKNATKVEIPQSYYFSSEESNANNSEPDDNNKNYY